MEKVLSALRPGGWIALWWNLWYDPNGPDAFSQALDPMFEEFGDRQSPAHVDQNQEDHWLPLMRPAGFEDVTAERFPGRSSSGATTSSRCSAPSPGCASDQRPSRRRCWSGFVPWPTKQFGGHGAADVPDRAVHGPQAGRLRLAQACATLSTALTMPS